jgi:tetratricopeptide (TPR) repeat protein
MFGFAWLAIRQAREALKQGRLEDAHRLLTQPATRDHRAVGDLLARLARGYVERGDRQLKLDDAEGAWRDLVQAEQLQTAEKGVDRLRQALNRLGVAEVRALLLAGEYRRADEAIARLHERRVRSPELQVLEDATRDWLQARELADHAEFALALDAVERVRRRLHERPKVLEQFAADLERHRDSFAGLLVRLHGAADAARWREVIELAEQVLAIAPHHAEARKARSRAWKAIEPVTVALPGPHSSPPPAEDGPPGRQGRVQSYSLPPCGGGLGWAGEALPGDALPTRFLLWIDGVGGYLVCLGGRLTFGQAILDAHVDVPLVADVSRLHASLMRDTEGYVLEAVRPIQVNAQNVTRTLLQSGDRVTLGTSCQFVFRLPVPISNTARLDLVSGHRLPLSVDAILLMADTLVLGDVPQVHITVPDLKDPVVLFRQKDTLGIRHGGKLCINGHKCGERLLLGDPHATVSGENISFAIEPVGARLG